MAVEPTPRSLASAANSCFQFSKPAEVLPHCAALALPPVHANAARATAATVLIDALFNMLSPVFYLLVFVDVIVDRAPLKIKA